MPDLINPDYNQGKKEFRIWVDELCKSCKVQDNCPLFQVLHRHTILTMTGMHVSNCELYEPDEESEYYLPLDATEEQARDINMRQIEQRLKIFTDKLENLNDDDLP